jgi:hypothetical protein
MEKNTCWSKKDPQKSKFSKNFSILIFFYPEALSNSPKVQMSQNRRKKLTEK